MAAPEQSHHKLAANRKALHDYFVVERLEAGIALQGTEVKAVRAAQVSLTGAYATVADGVATLLNANITPYEFGNRFNHDPLRPRRLLLHRREIERLQVSTQQKGCALIPLSVYLKRGVVKIELGVCKGKRQTDKREAMRRATADLEARRAIAAHR
jgi:SsrA-binding protein